MSDRKAETDHQLRHQVLKTSLTGYWSRGAASSVLCAALLTSACKKQEKAPPVGAAPSAAPSRQVPAALTTQDMEQVALGLRALVKQGQTKTANQAIDWQLLFDRATRGLKLPDEARKGFLENVPERTLFDQLAADSAEGATLSLVRARSEGTERSVLLREILPDGNYNHVELWVERDSAGVPRVTDFYVLRVGERMSETLRAELLPFAGKDSQLTTTDRAQMDNASVVDQLKEAAARADHTAVLEQYARLPAAAKSLKQVQLLRVQATASASPEACGAAVEELVLRFPDDPGAHMRRVAMGLQGDNLQATLDAIDALDKALGTDPYLDLQRSNAYAAAGNVAEAHRIAKRAAPKLDTPHGYLTMIATSLATKQLDDTLAALKALLSQHAFDFGDLSKEPEFQPFRAAPQFASWLEFRKQQHAAAAKTK